MAVIYFSPRRFDLAVRAISIRRRIASGRPGLSGWLEAHLSTLRSKSGYNRIRHPVLRWMAATLDGRVEATGAVFEANFMLPWSFSEEAAAEKHMGADHQYYFIGIMRGGDTPPAWVTGKALS